MQPTEHRNLKEFNRKTFADDQKIEDENIVCIDCGNDFIWTVGEQIFFRDKGLENPSADKKLYCWFITE